MAHNLGLGFRWPRLSPTLQRRRLAWQGIQSTCRSSNESTEPFNLSTCPSSSSERKKRKRSNNSRNDFINTFLHLCTLQAYVFFLYISQSQYQLPTLISQHSCMFLYFIRIKEQFFFKSGRKLWPTLCFATSSQDWVISLAKPAATGAPAACAATSTLASKKGTRSMPLSLCRLQRVRHHRGLFIRTLGIAQPYSQGLVFDERQEFRSWSSLNDKNYIFFMIRVLV